MTASTPQQPRRSWIAGSAGLTLVAAMVAAVTVVAQTSDDAVAVDGSSTVYQITREAVLAFKKVSPAVSVTLGKSGTGGGFGKYLDNKLDIVDASRPAKATEEAKAKAAGLAWSQLLIGYDGITVVVNKKNTFVKELTVEQLALLWGPESTIKTWKDLDPSWPDRKITFFCPDKDSGTFDFFTEAINGAVGKQRQGPDVQPNSDDNTLVTGVAGDEDAIGYFGYAYYSANTASLRAIPIKDTKAPKAVMPSPATIRNKTYWPLSRPLFIYVKKSSMSKPGVKAFVTYYINNAAKLALKARYVEPTAADDAANKKLLANP